MTSPQLVKAPDDKLDYDIDFSRWLPGGDIITAATATITGGTATIDSTEFSDTTVKVWITGGDEGDSSDVTVKATTQGGRIKEYCFRLRVRDC